MNKQQLTNLCFCCIVLAMAGCASSSDDEKCSQDMTSCNGTCFNLAMSAEHCGACDNDCSKAANVTGASCTNATCSIESCVNGYKDCDGNPSNGCEQYVGDSGQCSAGPTDKCESPKTVCPAGCFDLTSDKLNCGSCSNNCTDKGNITNAACEKSVCKIITCAANYSDCDANPDNGCEKYIGSGTCDNPDKAPDPIIPGDCQFTISYTNADTCSATGGTQDWNVYLIGEMNKSDDGSWKLTDPNFLMKSDDNCTRSVTFNVEDGKTYKYKFYVDGWADDSYRSDDNNAVDEDKNNQFTAVCGGSASFVEKAAPAKSEKCDVTFTYVNADTCLATGGLHDWPVYLIGDMNDWQTADPNMIMTADENCVRTITVKLEKDKVQKYKFYVDGWAEEAYRSDSTKAVDEDKNNQTDGTCGAAYNFVEKEAATPVPESEKCDVTFTYVNADTCETTGGTQNWPVYLIGEMNDWQPADANMLMNADEKCVRSITVKLEKDKAQQYKFYVAGWGEEAYRSDPAKTVGADDNNQTTGVCGEEYKYVEKEATTIIDPGNPEIEGGDCKATFTYYNQYTNTASGGAADFDVYLVGSFNTDDEGNWKTNDVAWKMISDGRGTHTLTVDLVKNQSYEYKYYVNGWDKDSWKTDAEDGVSNGIANMDACDKSFGSAKQDGPDIPVDPTKCYATFIYTNKYTNKASGGNDDFDVYLIGSMNEWKEADENLKMTSDGNGTHTITLELNEGEKYTYKYYVNGWEQDSYKANPYSCTDENCNSLADMSTCGQVFKYVEVPVGGESPDNPTQSSANCKLTAPPQVQNKVINFSIECSDGTSQIDNIDGGNNPQITGLSVTDTVPENGKYSYVIKAGDNEVYVPVWVEDKPFDWHDALLYFAFTDRFKDGDVSNNYNKKEASKNRTSDANWLGGDFKGLQQKVEDGYFENLGVNTLWISSVSMNAQGLSQGTNGDEAHFYSAYHSYWPVASLYTDSFNTDFVGAKSEGVDITPIEPHFGSMDDLKNLVDACHKHGIRVLVDFAANQVHKDSPIYRNHRDWFNDVDNPVVCDDERNGQKGWGWDNYSEKCWFSRDLPDLDYSKPEVRKAMVNHAIWLIKATNIDGFRVDAVKHMDVQFIKDLRKATDELFANSGSMFYMVGETFTGDISLLNKYIGNDLLHAQFDFPMYYALQSHILGLGNYASVAQLNNYFNSDLMGTFMGNHDVARAISVAAGQNQGKWGSNEEVSDWLPYLKMKTAWTILLTNPGVPLIYYGDEYGMEGSNDPDNRRMMEFDNALNNEQKVMLGYVQLLGKIRKEHKAITRGHRENLSYGGGYWCYKLTDGNESIIVGIARADGGNNSGCDLKGAYTLQNLLSEAHETRNNVTGLDLNNERLQVYLVK